MICGNCKKLIDEDAEFCPECGQRVVRDAAPRRAAEGEEKQKTDINKILIGILIGVAVILAGVIVFLLVNNSGKKTEAPVNEAAQTSTVSEVNLSVISGDSGTVQADNTPAAVTEANAGDESAAETQLSGNEQAQSNHVPAAQGNAQSTPSTQSRAAVQPGAISNAPFTSSVLSAYNQRFSYPSHFITDINTSDMFTAHAADGSAVMTVCVQGGTVSIGSLRSEYLEEHSGKVDYSNSNDTFFALSILSGGKYYYKYCKQLDGYVKWFEFVSTAENHKIFDDYINIIYKSML